MPRTWLLTWTTYGSWLPGDPRGSVASVRNGAGPRRENDTPGTPVAPSMPGLCEASRKRMTGDPILLTYAQAGIALRQFQATADYRGWRLLGAAIMANHVHLVVTVPDETTPEVAMRDFKAYATRELSRVQSRQQRWWTRRGSQRLLQNERTIATAIEYLRRQPHPLVLWFASDDQEISPAPPAP